MKRELERTLVKKYPVILKDYRGDMKETAMAFGFEHDDGWYTLVDELMGFLKFHTDVNKEPQVIAHQIKQKFGALCFYTNDEISQMQRGAIYFAQHLSTEICEKCGIIRSHTVLVKRRSIRGFIQTLCNTCNEVRINDTDRD